MKYFNGSNFVNLTNEKVFIVRHGSRFHAEVDTANYGMVDVIGVKPGSRKEVENQLIEKNINYEKY